MTARSDAITHAIAGKLEHARFKAAHLNMPCYIIAGAGHTLWVVSSGGMLYQTDRVLAVVAPDGTIQRQAKSWRGISI